MSHQEKKAFWLATVVEKYAAKHGASRVSAFGELAGSGAFSFLNKHYGVEHLLGFDEVLEEAQEIVNASEAAS
jgi:hypothetical protein